MGELEVQGAGASASAPGPTGGAGSVSVVLVHGVGLPPSLYTPVASLVRAQTGARTFGVARRGYDGTPPATSFEELVADVARMVAQDPPVVLVGVSGGATLALAAAVDRVPGVVGVVAHEPLVGPLAVDLHRMVTASADRLRTEAGGEGAVAFVERLVGRAAWSELDADTRSFVHRSAPAIRAEVPLFLQFAPSAADLGRIEIPVVVTTGAESGVARLDAAMVVTRSTGTARSELIAGAGHLVHVQQPWAFAGVIERLVRRVVDGDAS